ncbi:MAG: hypothetical protein WCD52_15175 [Xanthobacteraceae bacterium]
MTSAHSRTPAKSVRRLGIPFSAIEVDANLFVPGASVILDIWGHVQ